jgi:two-component system sensor histidine kinase PilS (NtrC family)
MIRRLKGFILFRTLVVTILLGSFYIFRISYGATVYPAGFSFLIASLYLLTVIYAIALRWVKNDSGYTVFVYVQIINDIIAEAVLLYVTGGIASGFAFLFPLTIVSASILLNRKACFIVATLCSILYGSLIGLQFIEIIPVAATFGGNAKEYFYNIFANITAFYLIAFLSGSLSERLHKTAISLEEKNIAVNDLLTFSRDMVESMPSGVLTINSERKIVTFNTSAQKITQYGFEEVAGRTPEYIFPFLAGAGAAEERREGEIFRNGRRIVIGIRFSVLRNGAGESIGHVGIFQDLTELKAMEAEIRRSMKWASVGELSASIAHELRNPLASLKASVEILREKRLTGEYADHLMEIALSEMDRLDNIVTDFLLYAKPQRMYKTSFDIHQSLNEVIMLLRSTETNNKNVTITSSLPGKLNITGDPEKLRQVFWNLGINAMDAISEDGTINIYTAKHENKISIVFHDSGVGLAKEDIEKIFDPFYTTKEKGTGLGLSIAQRIAEEHNGKITVKSDGVGTGAIFSVDLPVTNEPS